MSFACSQVSEYSTCTDFPSVIIFHYTFLYTAREQKHEMSSFCFFHGQDLFKRAGSKVVTARTHSTLDWLDGPSVIAWALKSRRGRRKRNSERFEAWEGFDILVLAWEELCVKGSGNLKPAMSGTGFCQWTVSLEDESDPQMSIIAQANTLILAWWDPKQRTQAHCARPHTYKCFKIMSVVLNHYICCNLLQQQKKINRINM